ncbi:NAD(P)-dependent alcohol dehydrogenase [Streptomyces sp. NPDC059740]|uniref:NAD(P)-dependent alcohol dehydrogenase n=1 Tax=Streptomyces sp. NPDC059740 TaxID=3346926 RepID=UPI0036664E20
MPSAEPVRPVRPAVATPAHQRAAVLHGPRDLRVSDRPVPVPGPGQVLVRVAAVGLCGSDLHYYADGRNGPNVLRQPTVLGHEASGVVLATGPGADRHALGTPVAVEPAHPCGRCAACRSGRYHQCPRGTCFGSPPTDGALSERVLVPEDFVHPLPEGLAVREGALVEPLAVAVHAVRRAGVTVGDRVLVTGAGPIGLLVLQVALAAGAAAVEVSDVSAARLRCAAGLGASAVHDAAELPPGPAATLADPAGFDVALDCSGNATALAAGLTRLRPGGTAVVVGNPTSDTTALPLAWAQRQEITLTTAFRYSAGDFPAAVALAASGRVRLAELVTATFPLEQAPQALETALTDRDQLKVLVVPGRSPAAGAATTAKEARS